MDESEVWTTLETLKELNRETNALIEAENQSLKIDKLQKLRDGLEELSCRLDRLYGGRGGAAVTVKPMRKNDGFEDIPKKLATPLITDLKVNKWGV